MTKEVELELMNIPHFPLYGRIIEDSAEKQKNLDIGSYLDESKR